MNEQTKKLFKYMAYLISVPIIVMVIMSLVFTVRGLYPFGNGTIAWCDMTQQVVPMIANFEDMLAGKTGFFFNMQNAGGMSMIGVVFFFVASPFNLLALAVPKQNLVLFMNVLTMFKLMAAGLTAMLFFTKCYKKLSPVISAALSVSYAFCGYAVVYYQNSIWLDVMYLFPLLMMGIYYLVTKNKLLPYVVTLSLMAVVNYYICYMIAVFCVLFFALVSAADKKGKYKHTGFLFLVGSVIAALLTAVVWLPSLLQYFVSGRTTSINENLAGASFLTEFQSVFRLLLYSAAAIVVCVLCVLDKTQTTKRLSVLLTMLFLLIVPMFVEPINLMWHTGSYMSFPCRFAFITVMFLLVCSAEILQDGSGHIQKQTQSKRECCIASVVCIAFYVFSVLLVNIVLRKNTSAISKYSRVLWSDDAFLAIEVKVFFIIVVGFGVTFACYKKGRLAKNAFNVLLCGFVIAQSVTALNIYIAGAPDYSIEKALQEISVYSLEGKIDDDSFYRVKTTNKHFDVNDIGALGYRSLSHYTSLTDRAYMYAMKKLGYSSYWMEVGSHGGTELTDALFSVKYKISKVPIENEKEVYSNNDYHIYQRRNFVGLGLVTDHDISQIDSFDGLDRFDVQQKLYQSLLAAEKDDEIITEYEPKSMGDVLINDHHNDILLTVFGKNNELTYDFFVKGRQMLYFDCFDQLSSNLYEPINGSFTVTVNETTIQNGYPSQSSNGLLRLGEFENCRVVVKINVLQNVQCTSFGVYGLEMNKLASSLEHAKSVGLTENNGVISGNYQANEGEKCVLFVPYSKTFNVQINGEKVEYQKAVDDFIMFDLKAGKNEIRITSEPMGLTTGIILTAVGVLLAGVCCVMRKKFKPDDTVFAVCRAAVIIIGVLAFAVIYVYPVLVNCIGLAK